MWMGPTSGIRGNEVLSYYAHILSCFLFRPLRDSILIFFRCSRVMLNFQRKAKITCVCSFISMILLVLYLAKMLTFLVCQKNLLIISFEIRSFQR